MRTNKRACRCVHVQVREEFGIVIHIVEDITRLYVVQSVKKVFQKTIQIVFGNNSWY